jgi:hypothetical protein
MTDKEGTLRMMASGRWAVYRPGHLPHEIRSGELFRVEVAGANGLQLTRMEYNHTDRQYYSVTAIRCAMVCAPQLASKDSQKFRRRSQQFAGPRAAATLSLSTRSATDATVG